MIAIGIKNLDKGDTFVCAKARLTESALRRMDPIHHRWMIISNVMRRSLLVRNGDGGSWSRLAWITGNHPIGMPYHWANWHSGALKVNCWVCVCHSINVNSKIFAFYLFIYFVLLLNLIVWYIFFFSFLFFRFYIFSVCFCLR